MNEALKVLFQLCRCLQVSDCGDERIGAAGLPKCVDQWKSVIELANAYYLTPALWLALEEKGEIASLPPDAHDFLKEAHRLNRSRNQRIRDQAAEFITALNGAGISSVVLKGGAYLFDGNEGAFATRMMVDLDVLVPNQDLERSLTVALSLGYRDLDVASLRKHQLPPLGRDGDVATLEIHRDVGPQRIILSAESVFQRAVSLEFEDARVRIPSLSHRVVHGVFHSEIQGQSNYALGRIPLRYLHDMMLLRHRHEQEIDWGEVQQSLSRQGYGRIVPGFVYLADRLLGLRMPEALPATPGAKRHYAWCVAQIRWPALRAIVSVWGALAHPFRRSTVEYVYGEHARLGALQVNRLKYLHALVLAYRGRSLSKLSAVFRRMFRV